jgi:hypothetical protein
MNSPLMQYEKRELRNSEIDNLISDIKKVPYLIAGNRKRWKKINLFYIAKTGSDLIGVCGIVYLKNCIKLGPFVILEKHRGKGFGKILIDKILIDHPKHNFFIGSETPSVWKIALNFGFKQTAFLKIPFEIRKYLIFQIIQSLFNFSMLREGFAKFLKRKNRYLCFFRISG